MIPYDKSNQVPKIPTATYLEQYYQDRKTEIDAYMKKKYKPVTITELQKYMEHLHITNQHMIRTTAWSKKLRIGILGTDGGIIQSFGCHVGHVKQDSGSKNKITTGAASAKKVLVFDMDDEKNSDLNFIEEYSFDLAGVILRDIVDHKMSWEHAFASMRVQLSRSPDIYDTSFMICFRYGTTAPKVVSKYAAQRIEQETSKDLEMIELPGLEGVEIQRYCPHQGADLKHASVVNGVIRCHRHGWTFCAESGKCLSGGNSDLKINKLAW